MRQKYEEINSIQYELPLKSMSYYFNEDFLKFIEVLPTSENYLTDMLPHLSEKQLGNLMQNYIPKEKLPGFLVSYPNAANRESLSFLEEDKLLYCFINLTDTKILTDNLDITNKNQILNLYQEVSQNLQNLKSSMDYYKRLISAFDWLGITGIQKNNEHHTNDSSNGGRCDPTGIILLVLLLPVIVSLLIAMYTIMLISSIVACSIKATKLASLEQQLSEANECYNKDAQDVIDGYENLKTYHNGLRQVGLFRNSGNKEDNLLEIPLNKTASFDDSGSDKELVLSF